MSKPTNSNRDLIEHNTQALHKHLQIQFCGVITKLTQEIDEIKHTEVRVPLDSLQIKLNMACNLYCNSPIEDLKQSVEAFHRTCQDAFQEYRLSPDIQKVLHGSDVAQETIDNMFARANNGIQSAIDYTLKDNSMPNAEQHRISTSYQLLGILGTRLRQLSGQNKKEYLEEKDTPIPPPITGP